MESLRVCLIAVLTFTLAVINGMTVWQLVTPLSRGMERISVPL